MAYINVDEVYILDNTGAQVDAVTDIPFKADAGLTDAQKAQARQNLGISAGGGVNRNMLDNPWFTINQRDVAVGVIVNSSNYIADRWVATGSAGAQRNADGTITNNATIYQKLSATIPVGKSVTFSVLLGDGTMETWTDVFDGSSTKTMDLPSFGTTRFYMGSTPPQINIGACAKTIVAVKLELGTTSTLAQDAPPDYGTELAKCMRYFQRIKGTSTNYAPIGLGFTTSASSGVIAAVLVPLPVPLRATTVTVSKSGNLSLLSGTTSYTPTAITYYDHTEQQLRLNVTASGMTAGQFCYLQFSQSAAYIDLSADL